MASGAANQINAFWSRMVQACVFVTSIGSMNIISHTLSYVAVEISSAKYDVGVQKKQKGPSTAAGFMDEIVDVFDDKLRIGCSNRRFDKTNLCKT
jgi:hypothetical protein